MIGLRHGRQLHRNPHTCEPCCGVRDGSAVSRLTSGGPTTRRNRPMAAPCRHTHVLLYDSSRPTATPADYDPGSWQSRRLGFPGSRWEANFLVIAAPSNPYDGSIRTKSRCAMPRDRLIISIDLHPGGRVYRRHMGRDGLLIGEVAQRSGVSRKALRLYESAGILPSARRTASGYRVYGSDALDIVSFVRQAQRLGFTLEQIKIVAIKRNGRCPCPHVRDLVRHKVDELDQQLSDLQVVRDGLRARLKQWRRGTRMPAAVCPHIEARAATSKEAKR
jgi:MerR family transcriptional regulator, copper efflux regulator